MSGFRRERKIYKLRFADPELGGLIVRMRPAPVRAILNATKLAGFASDPGSIDTEGLDALASMFRDFADALVDWNLLDNGGEPVPATFDGVCGEDAEFIFRLFAVWTEKSSGVSQNLDQTSNGGGSLDLALIPVELSSTSPAN